MSPENEQLVLNHLLEIKQDIGSMNTKLDALNITMDKHVGEDNVLHKDVEQRIVEIEAYQNKQRGSSRVWNLVMNAVIGIVGAILGSHAGK